MSEETTTKEVFICASCGDYVSLETPSPLCEESLKPCAPKITNFDFETFKETYKTELQTKYDERGRALTLCAIQVATFAGLREEIKAKGGDAFDPENAAKTIEDVLVLATEQIADMVTRLAQ